MQDARRQFIEKLHLVIRIVHSFKRCALGTPRCKVTRHWTAYSTPHLRLGIAPLKRHSLGTKGVHLEPGAMLSKGVPLPFLFFSS